MNVQYRMLQTAEWKIPLETLFSGSLKTGYSLQMVENKMQRQRSNTVQLTTILNVIDETSDIQSLLDIKRVRQTFLKEYMEVKEYEAGTIKSYLMSLRHFFHFFCRMNLRKFPLTPRM